MDPVAVICASPFGMTFWSLLVKFGALVGNNVDAAKLAGLLTVDVLQHKTNVEAIDDVLSHANEVFTNPATRAEFVSAVTGLRYFANLFPHAPVPVPPAPTPAPAPAPAGPSV